MEYLADLGAVLWQGLMPILTAALVAYLISLVKQWRDKLKDEKLRAFIDELVRAAEQIYGAGEGAAKYDFVVRQAQQRSCRLRRAEVEAAVYDITP